MTDDTYNGWANYPTWCVHLWLTNEEPLYRSALSIAEQLQYDADYVVADEFKTWVRDELSPDLGATFAADLLGYALDEVDWLEIAQAFLEQVNEE